MTSAHLLAGEATDPSLNRPTVPLPLLGWLLGLGWLVVGVIEQFFVPPGSTAGVPQSFGIVATAVGAALLVVPPLVLTEIPARLRRQALLFLVLAGAWYVASEILASTAPLISVVFWGGPTLYAIGWMRLRDRSPLLTLVALATPVLQLACGWADRTVYQYATSFSAKGAVDHEEIWGIVVGLVVGAIPVCVPVLAVGLVDRARAVPSPWSVETAGPSGPVPEWNVAAVASLVLALSAASVLAIVMGHVAHAQIVRTREKVGGFAIAGLVLGYGSIIVVGILIWLIYEAFKNWTFTF